MSGLLIDELRSAEHIKDIILKAGGKLPDERSPEPRDKTECEDEGGIPIELFESSTKLVRDSLPLQLQRKKPYRL